MLNALNLKEKIIFFIFPVLMMCVVLFQGWQANHWRAEAERQRERKEMWQSQYISQKQQIERFVSQQAELLQAVQQLQQHQQQQQEELNHALHKHQDWSNQPVPNDVRKLLNQNSAH